VLGHCPHPIVPSSWRGGEIMDLAIWLLLIWIALVALVGLP